MAIWFAYEGAKDFIERYKRFNKADRMATARIVEFEPGVRGGLPPDYIDEGDPGRPPRSYYQFKVNEKTYDGLVEAELPVGKPIQIRYNSSDPSFNHAEDDHAHWPSRKIVDDALILFVVLVFLVKVVREKNQAHTV